MKASSYVEVVKRLVAQGVSEASLAENLVAHLKRSGRMKLMPQIMRALKTEKTQAQLTGAYVEVAHATDEAEALRAARAEGIEATHAHVNHTLISGWRARKSGILIDRSGKRALIDLYRRVTKA